ncbi:hypothetical protein ACIOJD_01310 [Streptomyces sp. NPDC088116]
MRQIFRPVLRRLAEVANLLNGVDTARARGAAEELTEYARSKGQS